MEEQNLPIALMSQQVSDAEAKKSGIVDLSMKDILYSFIKQRYREDEIGVYVQQVINGDYIEKHHGAIAIRKLISGKDIRQQQILQILASRPFSNRLMEEAKQDQFLHLKKEALWIIVNGCGHSSDFCNTYVGLGVVSLVLDNLPKPNCEDIVELMVWILGNVSGNSAQCRNQLISSNAVPMLIQTTEKHKSNTSILEKGCWALTNLFTPAQPSFSKQMESIIHFFLKIAEHNPIQDRQTRQPLCFSIVQYAELNTSWIETVSQVINRLLAKNVTSLTQFSTLCIFLRKKSNNKVQVDAAMNHKQKFLNLLTAKMKITSVEDRKQAQRVLAAVVKSQYDYFADLLCCHDLMRAMMYIYETGTSSERARVCKFVISAIKNAEPLVVCGFLNQWMHEIIDSFKEKVVPTYICCVTLFEIAQFLERQRGLEENRLVANLRSWRNPTFEERACSTSSEDKQEVLSRIILLFLKEESA